MSVLSGTCLLLKITLPHLIRSRWGHVICISSTARIKGGAAIALCGASKHGVPEQVRTSGRLGGGRAPHPVRLVCRTRLQTDIVAFRTARRTGPGSLSATEANLVRATHAEPVLPGLVPIPAVARAVARIISEGAAQVTGAGRARRCWCTAQPRYKQVTVGR